MKRFLIVKLDTPCTLKNSAMRVPQAEPVNFAKALIQANPDETIDVCMLGTYQDTMEHGHFGTIRIVPYFGDPRQLKDEIDETTRIIIWQGRHVFNVSQPTDPMTVSAKPVLMEPFNAGDYERIQLYKVWQVMMYNLLSSNVIPEEAQKYCIVTDVRCPMVELNKIDPIAVPKPLPKNIVLVTQAYHADEYLKWYLKYCNAMPYPEVNIADYTYQFKKAIYLPLHSLPIMSHAKHRKLLADKTGTSIFQVQSLRYIDDYRKRSLRNALKFVDGNCTLHGRFRSEERGVVVAEFPLYVDKLLAQLIDNSDNPAESFHDSAKILSNYQASLIVTDQRYARFGLCPNRFVESIAVGTVPLLANDDVLRYCDPTLQAINKELGICPEHTEVTKHTADAKRSMDVIVRDDRGCVIDSHAIDKQLSDAKTKLQEQLMYELNKFANIVD